jgi:hypothetical protein
MRAHSGSENNEAIRSTEFRDWYPGDGGYGI